MAQSNLSGTCNGQILRLSTDDILEGRPTPSGRTRCGYCGRNLVRNFHVHRRVARVCDSTGRARARLNELLALLPNPVRRDPLALRRPARPGEVLQPTRTDSYLAIKGCVGLRALGLGDQIPAWLQGPTSEAASDGRPWPTDARRRPRCFGPPAGARSVRQRAAAPSDSFPGHLPDRPVAQA